MSKKSNRNRHTGRINAFKAMILSRGAPFVAGETEYKIFGGRYYEGLGGEERILHIGTAVRVPDAVIA